MIPTLERKEVALIYRSEEVCEEEATKLQGTEVVEQVYRSNEDRPSDAEEQTIQHVQLGVEAHIKVSFAPSVFEFLWRKYFRRLNHNEHKCSRNHDHQYNKQNYRNRSISCILIQTLIWCWQIEQAAENDVEVTFKDEHEEVVEKELFFEIWVQFFCLDKASWGRPEKHEDDLHLDDEEEQH